VWLDAQGRVRQVAYQLILPPATSSPTDPGSTTGATSSSFSATIDFYDFGIPVDVTAPPADQVDNVTSQAVAAGSAAPATTTPPTSTTTTPEVCGWTDNDSPGATALDPLLLTSADVPHGYATSGPNPSTSTPFDGKLPQSVPIDSITFSTTTGPELERIDESVARDTSAQAATDLAHQLQGIEASCSSDSATVALPGAVANLVATTTSGDDSSDAEVYTSKGPYLLEVSWNKSVNLYYTGKTGAQPLPPTPAVMSSIVDSALDRIPARGWTATANTTFEEPGRRGGWQAKGGNVRGGRSCQILLREPSWQRRLGWSPERKRKGRLYSEECWVRPPMLWEKLWDAGWSIAPEMWAGCSKRQMRS
jgi:hypothetical protein